MKRKTASKLTEILTGPRRLQFKPDVLENVFQIHDRSVHILNRINIFAHMSCSQKLLFFGSSIDFPYSLTNLVVVYLASFDILGRCEHRE